MLLTIKNKKHEVLVDDTKKQMSHLIVMNNASVDFTENMTFIMFDAISDVITDFEARIVDADSAFNIAYRDGMSSNFIQTKIAIEANVRVQNSNSKQIRKFNLALTSSEEIIHTCIFRIKFKRNGVQEEYLFNVFCEVVGIDDKYVILCQNFKFDITPDYYDAFMQSEHKSSNPDERLLNEKRKEFLLNYFDLDAEIGTYKTLLAALAYFGYGDLLSIRELWKNAEGVYSSQELSTKVLDFIDNRLLGFKKTNQLQLIYKINTEDGTLDEDGLPNYITVLFDTEMILIKMHALKRILERDFMPLNTKIVDIIGEHTSVVGIDSRIWMNDVRIQNVDMNNQDKVELVLDQESTDIEINEHEVLLRKPRLLIVSHGQNPDTVEYPAGVTSSDFNLVRYFEITKDLIYDIESQDDLDALLDDYDYVQRYYRGDFGLVKMNLTFDTTKYRRWKYQVYDLAVSEVVPEFETQLYDISTISDQVMVGIRKTGTFKIIFYLFDHYGGVTIIGNKEDSFKITNGNVNFKLARIDRTDTGFDKGIDLFSTFQIKPAADYSQAQFDADKTIVVDPFDDTFDVNTFSEVGNTNQVLRYNTKNFNTRSMFIDSFEFNLIPVNKLVNTRIQDYGYEYSKRIIDLHADGTGTTRRIGMQMFEHDPISYITVPVGASSLETCTAFVTAFNSISFSPIWSRFTVTLDRFSIDGMAPNFKYVIKIVGKEAGESTSNSFITTTEIAALNPIALSNENWNSIMPISAYIRLVPIAFSFTQSVLTISVNNVSYQTPAVVNSVTALFTAINIMITTNNLDASVFEYNDEVIVCSRHDVYVDHASIGGKHFEVARGKESATLKIAPAGDTIWLGEPFYAYPDLYSKIELLNCRWTLSDALTGEVLDTQHSYVYRNILMQSGSYTLQLDTIDIFGTNRKIKNGFVTVA